MTRASPPDKSCTSGVLEKSYHDHIMKTEATQEIHPSVGLSQCVNQLYVLERNKILIGLQLLEEADNLSKLEQKGFQSEDDSGGVGGWWLA